MPKTANLLTVDDVAELLQCSTRHVQRLVEARQFPQPLKLGRLTRWRESDVEEWIKKQV